MSALNRMRRPVLAACCALLLAGCAGEPLSPTLRAMPQRVELSGVPFFAQNAYQGAPAALAALLNQQGDEVSPGMIEKALKLPQQETALREGLVTTARQHGLLVYPLEARLEDLLEQVVAGNPVLLYLEDSFNLGDAGRYALLVGYELDNRKVLLRLGHERRALVSFSSFESRWQAAGGWAVLVLAPNQLPASVDRTRWLKSADELAAAGQDNAAKMARLQVE